MKSLNLKSIYIYLIGLCVLFFLFFVSYYKYKIKNETQSYHETIKVIISKVVCNKYNSRGNYIVFKFNKFNHIMNLGRQECESYRVGDSLNLLYNKNHDLFYTTEIDTRSEKGGMVISGVFILIVFFYLFVSSDKRI